MELNFSKVDWGQEASAREKGYFVVILLLIAFAFARVVWLPTLAKNKTKTQEIQNVELQISTLKKFIDINKKIEPQRRSIQSKGLKGRLENALKDMPDDPQQAIAQVVQKITSRKLLGRVTLESVSFDSPIAHTGYAAVPIILSIEGTFSATQNYLSSLEKLNYLFTVDNVIFESSNDYPGLINATLKCNFYVAGIKVPETKSEIGVKGKKGKKGSKEKK